MEKEVRRKKEGKDSVFFFFLIYRFFLEKNIIFYR